MPYRFYISTNSGVSYSEVFPVKRPKIKTAYEGEEIFERDAISDDIKIRRGDNLAAYQTLENWFNDSTKFQTEILFKIDRGSDNIYNGYFSVTDCIIDREKGTVVFRPRINDAYRPTMDIYDAEYDTAFSFSYGTELRTTTVITEWTNSVGQGYDTFTASGAVISSAIKTQTDDVAEATSNATDKSFAVGDYLIIDYNLTLNSGTAPDLETYVTGGAQINSSTLQNGAHQLSIEITSAGTLTFLLTNASPDQTNCALTFTAYKRQRWENGAYPLKNAITDILDNQTGLFASSDVVSTFLWNDSLSTDAPSAISTYMAANPTHNYKTQAVNKLNELILIHRGALAGDQDSVLGKFSLQTLIGWLRLLNCYWYIDPDGRFRIEHVSWFETYATGIDITAIDSGKWLRGSNIFSFNKDLLFHREHFEINDSDGQDFVGKDIIYSTAETIPVIRNVNIGDLAVDFQYFNDNITSYENNDGYMLVQASDVDAYTTGYFLVGWETGALSSTSVPNGHLSIANLMETYLTNRRYAKTATVNGSAKTFSSWIWAKTQEPVKFPYRADIDFRQTMTTDEGAGKPTEIMRSLDTDIIEVTLTYNPYI